MAEWRMGNGRMENGEWQNGEWEWRTRLLYKTRQLKTITTKCIAQLYKQLAKESAVCVAFTLCGLTSCLSNSYMTRL